MFLEMFLVFQIDRGNLIMMETSFSKEDRCDGRHCLCFCEDNEAGIKMIMKGRSPTMRDVSRTHRVALDW